MRRVGNHVAPGRTDGCVLGVYYVGTRGVMGVYRGCIGDISGVYEGCIEGVVGVC